MWAPAGMHQAVCWVFTNMMWHRPTSCVGREHTHQWTKSGKDRVTEVMVKSKLILQAHTPPEQHHGVWSNEDEDAVSTHCSSLKKQNPKTLYSSFLLCPKVICKLCFSQTNRQPQVPGHPHWRAALPKSSPAAPALSQVSATQAIHVAAGVHLLHQARGKHPVGLRGGTGLWHLFTTGMSPMSHWVRGFANLGQIAEPQLSQRLHKRFCRAGGRQSHTETQAISPRVKATVMLKISRSNRQPVVNQSVG